VLLRTRVIAVAFAAVGFGVWAPAADAAFVGKRAARAYVLHNVPPGAPRVMLGDERAAFFRTERLWVQPAERCRRRSAVAVSCRIVARLVPDAEHRRANWWPIACRGSVLVGRLDDGRLKGSQLDYVCRTVRS
jgi:hypothetical protein